MKPVFLIPPKATFNPTGVINTGNARVINPARPLPASKNALKPYQMGYNANGTKKGAKELRFL